MNFLCSFLLGFVLLQKSIFKPFIICHAHKNCPTFRNTVAFAQLRPVKGDKDLGKMTSDKSIGLLLFWAL